MQTVELAVAEKVFSRQHSGIYYITPSYTEEKSKIWSILRISYYDQYQMGIYGVFPIGKSLLY